MPRPPLAVVTWDDAWHTLDGADVDGADAPYRVRTAGWIIRDTPRAVVIAAELLPCGTPRGVTRIPRAVVISVRVL